MGQLAFRVCSPIDVAGLSDSFSGGEKVAGAGINCFISKHIGQVVNVLRGRMAGQGGVLECILIIGQPVVCVGRKDPTQGHPRGLGSKQQLHILLE